MSLRIVNVGFGNVIAADRVVCITKADAAPVRRLIDHAESDNRLVNATNGRRTRSVIVTDSNHIVLSHMTVGTIAEKLRRGDIDDTEEDAP